MQSATSTLEDILHVIQCYMLRRVVTIKSKLTVLGGHYINFKHTICLARLLSRESRTLLASWSISTGDDGYNPNIAQLSNIAHTCRVLT